MSVWLKKVLRYNNTANTNTLHENSARYYKVQYNAGIVLCVCTSQRDVFTTCATITAVDAKHKTLALGNHVGVLLKHCTLRVLSQPRFASMCMNHVVMVLYV
jgi:hypothetical protein